METLTLSKALNLYQLLGDHIPEYENDEDPLEFIGKIISNLRQSNQPGDYVDAITLMSGKTVSELNEMASEERLELFISGAMQNRIVQLKSFCDIIGFNHG